MMENVPFFLLKSDVNAELEGHSGNAILKRLEVSSVGDRSLSFKQRDRINESSPSDGIRVPPGEKFIKCVSVGFWKHNRCIYQSPAEVSQIATQQNLTFEQFLQRIRRVWGLCNNLGVGRVGNQKNRGYHAKKTHKDPTYQQVDIPTDIRATNAASKCLV